MLSPLLPTARQTRFLRACVLNGQSGRDAWSQWEADATREGTPLVDTLEPFTPFLPLLSWNLARVGIAVKDERVIARLHAARQAEALRWLKYRVDAHAAFTVLHEADVPFIVLKGAAVSELIYPSPALRPKADIDVWLRPADLPRAAALFRERGWRQFEAEGLENPQHLPALVRGDSHPVELHRRLLLPYFALPDAQLWARSAPATLAGIETRALSDADGLLHTLGHAMSAYGLPMLPWVVDTHFMLERTASFDWPLFVGTTRSANLSLAVHTALHYLVDELGVEIPMRVMEELQHAARRAGVRARAAARLAVRPWPEGSLSVIWRTREPWRRVSLLVQRVFPPPMEFALRYDLPLWALPYYYVLRIVRYARAHRPRPG